MARKLTAVLYADVGGYSRLTGDDEEGTHRRLSAVGFTMRPQGGAWLLE